MGYTTKKMPKYTREGFKVLVQLKIKSLLNRVFPHLNLAVIFGT